jgi:hypothetical protein
MQDKGQNYSSIVIGDSLSGIKKAAVIEVLRNAKI